VTENTTQDVLGRDLVLKEKYDALKAELEQCILARAELRRSLRSVNKSYEGVLKKLQEARSKQRYYLLGVIATLLDATEPPTEGCNCADCTAKREARELLEANND